VRLRLRGWWWFPVLFQLWLVGVLIARGHWVTLAWGLALCTLGWVPVCVWEYQRAKRQNTSRNDDTACDCKAAAAKRSAP
jgi:hypothetical protein